MKHILRHELNEPESTDFGPKDGGYNLLNVPSNIYNEGPGEFWENVNKPWLDKAIARGDNIHLATPYDPRFFKDRNGNPTTFGMEIEHLEKQGYTYDPSTQMMVLK